MKSQATEETIYSSDVNFSESNTQKQDYETIYF